MSNHTGGPTLNVTYNNLLKDWAKVGCSSVPECEECQTETWDKRMYDIGTLWVCHDCYVMHTEGAPDDECLDYGDHHSIGPDPDREDFHSDG